MAKFSMRHQPPDIWIKSRIEPVSMREIMQRYNMTDEGVGRMMAALERDRKVARVTVNGEARWWNPQRGV